MSQCMVQAVSSLVVVKLLAFSFNSSSKVDIFVCRFIIHLLGMTCDLIR